MSLLSIGKVAVCVKSIDIDGLVLTDSISIDINDNMRGRGLCARSRGCNAAETTDKQLSSVRM